MNNSIAVQWAAPAFPEISDEEKFFVVAVHYYKTRACGNYLEGTLSAAGREFGLSEERIEAIGSMADDYVTNECRPHRRSKFRPVPSETSNIELEKAA